MTNLSKPQERMITSAEVCRILRCSRTTLWRRMNTGAISYHKYGNKLLFKMTDVIDFINQNYVSDEYR